MKYRFGTPTNRNLVLVKVTVLILVLLVVFIIVLNLIKSEVYIDATDTTSDIVFWEYVDHNNDQISEWVPVTVDDLMGTEAQAK